jgi:N-methylhydantoinase A
MQFDGQTHVLSVDLASSAPTLVELEQAFLAAYEARFHVSLPGMRPVLVNLHTSVIGKRPALPIASFIAHRRAESVQAAVIGERQVWFDGGWHMTLIYERDAIPIGASLSGPAILNQLDTTVVIEPNQAVRVDECGNVLIELVPIATDAAVSAALTMESTA